MVKEDLREFKQTVGHLYQFRSLWNSSGHYHVPCIAASARLVKPWQIIVHLLIKYEILALISWNARTDAQTPPITYYVGKFFSSSSRSCCSPSEPKESTDPTEPLNKYCLVICYKTWFVSGSTQDAEQEEVEDGGPALFDWWIVIYCVL